jgi:hypothetical protein
MYLMKEMTYEEDKFWEKQLSFEMPAYGSEQGDLRITSSDSK